VPRRCCVKTDFDLDGYDYLVFDCDGVILDSNNLKTAGFRFALRNEPEPLVDELVNYHLQHGGISRQEKFAYYFDVLKGQVDHSLSRRALDDFANYVQDAMAHVELISGIRDFLQDVKSKGIPAYVVSGGSQAEILDIFSKKQLSGFFRRISGNPTPKHKLMDQLYSDGLFTGKGLYFGDAQLDFELASEYGMEFMFVSGASDWGKGLSAAKENGFGVIENFAILSPSRV